MVSKIEFKHQRKPKALKMNAEIEKIPNFDIAVKAESLEDDLFTMYSRLFPGTVRSDLTFEELQGGYVNSIMRLADFLSMLSNIHEILQKIFRRGPSNKLKTSGVQTLIRWIIKTSLSSLQGDTENGRQR